MKKNMLVAGALLGSVFVLSGCQFDVDLGDREQAVSSYEVTDKVATLDLATGSGEIVITESNRSGVHVTETIHWAGKKPKPEHSVDGDTLTLRDKCRGNCSVDYKVEISQGLTVKLDTGSGIITLRGLTGEVNASTGSGDIEAGNLGSKEFVAETGSGDIEVKFAVMPDKVAIETGSGNATARLPQGAYNVSAETGSGKETVQVTDDPSAPRVVTVRTGSGDAEILLP